MFKRAQVELGVIVIIVIIIVFLGWLITLSNRECNKNSDCKQDEYCGVDHSCNKIPVITKTETSVYRSYNLIGPAIIIAIALIITAIILRWDKIKPQKEEKIVEAQPKETQKTLEPSYEYFTNFPPATNTKR